MSVAVDREQELIAEVRTIARDVAAVHADDVDRVGRFPAETIGALRAAGALSAPVPEALGGGGVSLGRDRGVLPGAGTLVRGQRHGLRHAPHPAADDRAPPGPRQLV